MKRLLLGLALFASVSCFASTEVAPAYLESNDKINEMLEQVSEEEENSFSIILGHTIDLSFYDYIPGISYLTVTSALESHSEEKGINEIMDKYCSLTQDNESKADSVETSFGDPTGCAVQQSNSSLSACIRYDFSCN